MPTLTKAQLASLARQLAPFVASEVAPLLVSEVRELARSTGKYVKGTHAIAEFIGVSTDTLLRRMKQTPSGMRRVPVCGHEEYNHRGNIRLRPICKREDLEAYRTNPSQTASAVPTNRSK